MNKLKISPFYSAKITYDKFYLEHKFTKKIIIVNELLYNLFNNSKTKLFGIKKADIKKLKSDKLLELLLTENILLEWETLYSDISFFFVRPRFTLFGLPYSELEKKNKNISIVGIPFSLGNPTQNNLNKNLNLIRDYAKKYNFNFKNRLSLNEKDKSNETENIYDLGDLYINERENAVALREKISKLAEYLAKNNNKFVAIGGDHSITYSLFNGVKKHHNDLVCIHIDAHNDLFLLEECNFIDLSPSHGSVIAKLLSENNLIYSVGLREFVNIESFKFKDSNNYNQYLGKGLNFLNEIDLLLNTIDKNKTIYLTIDIDVIDPLYFSSVTDKLPNGIDFNLLTTGINKILEKLDVVAIDIVEANLKIKKKIDIHNFLNFLIKLIIKYNEKH